MKVIQVMPNFELAGAEVMCENLVYSLRKQGIDVVVVSLFDRHTAITDRMEAAGVQIRYLHKKSGLDLSMISKLCKVFKEEKPDVIHTHLYVMQYAIPAAVWAGVKKRVHTVHNVADKETRRKAARKLNLLFYKLCGVTPVALSNIIQSTVEKEYSLDTEKIPVVLNGINLDNCLVKTDYTLGSVFKILHIGRFSAQKNHRMLLEAYAQFHEKYPQSELYLLGDGELKGECQTLAETLCISDSVRFLGVQSNVYPYLQDADIFTLPSCYEGIPMTLIEAMSSALPIVATKVGGIPDMLCDGKSALLTEVNANAVAHAFEMMYTDLELRKRLAAHAKKDSVLFSSDEMARKYIEIYSKEQ